MNSKKISIDLVSKNKNDIQINIPDEGLFWEKVANKYEEKVEEMVGKDLHKSICGQLQNLKKLGKVLEIGSGTGYFSRHLLKNADSVIGVDVSPKMVDVATENVKKMGLSNKIQFKVGNCKALTFGNEEFDSVFIINVLHMILSPEIALKEASRVLKKDGRIVVVSYNSKGMSTSQQKEAVVRFLKVWGLENSKHQRKFSHDFSFKDYEELIKGESSLEIEEKKIIGDKTGIMQSVYFIMKKVI